MRSKAARVEAIRRLSVGFAVLWAVLITLLWFGVGDIPISAPIGLALLAPLLIFLAISIKPESNSLRHSQPRILILGKNNIAGKLYREIAKKFGGGNSGPSSELPVFASSSAADLEDPEQLKELILQEGISQVVIAEADLEDQEEIASILIECKFRGVRIQNATDFYEELNQKVWLEALWPGWFIFSEGFQISRPKRILKRAFDLFLAVLFLIGLAPLMILIALAVKLTSPGPILFKQTRIGQFGVPFTLYKFRSMHKDAEEHTGPVWAREDDDRATFLGGFLRRSHLDELPQIFNVLRGEISFVGPRPERPVFVEWLETQIPFYHLRHYVKPGITGWAQVRLKYSDSVEASYEKLQYDLYHSKHASFRFEARILLETVRQVLLGGGR